MSKSIVSIVKGDNALDMVDEALSLLGGVSSLIIKNSTVVIKPNAGHFFPPEAGVNTSPQMVHAVIKVLKRAHPKKIILAESSGMGTETMKNLEISGIKAAAEDAGIDDIIDIKSEKDLIRVPIRDARSELTRVELPRFIIEADHIINLPIFKSHVSVVFTCALKNIKGLVQDRTHLRMHQTNLVDAIIDVWSVIRPDLTIVDMIRPAEGFGPTSAIPVDFGCVVAGKDPVAVDATICRMVGLDVHNVSYFRPAFERGIGEYEEGSIDIRGRSIKEVFKRLWIPYLGGFKQWPEYNILAENACSSCQGLLAYTMELLKALGEYERNKGIHILIGQKKELPSDVSPENLILVGNCLKKHYKHGIGVTGCPPNGPFPLMAILERMDMIEEKDKERAMEKHDYNEIINIFREYVLNMRTMHVEV